MAYAPMNDVSIIKYYKSDIKMTNAHNFHPADYILKKEEYLKSNNKISVCKIIFKQSPRRPRLLTDHNHN